MISHDFIGKQGRCRLDYIALKRDDRGGLEYVLLTLRQID